MFKSQQKNKKKSIRYIAGDLGKKASQVGVY